MSRSPALIAGGGPAGAAAAILLARGGAPPRLIERSEGPHDKVCGGFLGWDCLAALEALGVAPARLGARPIARLRLKSAADEAAAALPYPAAGLSRRVLDEALLAAAREAGALVERGVAIRSADLERRALRLESGDEAAGDALLLATGKHELRGAARPRDTSNDPVGLRTSLRPSPALERALDGVIELHLFDGGYAGLLLQEDGTANLCLSVARARVKAAGGIAGLIEALRAELPRFDERLRAGEAGEWSAIAGVPYGWRAEPDGSGVYRLGDQGAVIASLAGDGIAIALASGREAARAVLAGEDSAVYQARLARRASRPLKVAEALRWAAERPAPRSALMRLVRAVPAAPGLAARLTRIGT
ncbi:MAG: NAD(P)/FAD-dependent oxidoreductase [Allosphingosinicella sp.]